MGGDKPQEDKKAAKPEQPAPFQDRRRNLLTIAVVGGLMLLEGVGLFFAAKMFTPTAVSLAESEGPPKPVDENGQPLPEHTEIHVTDLMAFNSKTGQVFVYQLMVYARVATEHAAQVRDLIENRQHTIQDRLSRLVRASDPKLLEDPGLDTLRRQFEQELNAIFGEDRLILEVLLPQFSVSRAD